MQPAGASAEKVVKMWNCTLENMSSKHQSFAWQAREEASEAVRAAAEQGQQQALQEAAERQAATAAFGQALLRSLQRSLSLALHCAKAMSAAAEELSASGLQHEEVIKLAVPLYASLFHRVCTFHMRASCPPCFVAMAA